MRGWEARGFTRTVTVTGCVPARDSSGLWRLAAAGDAVLQERFFEVCVLDEATQAPEPAALVAVAQRVSDVLQDTRHRVEGTVHRGFVHVAHGTGHRAYGTGYRA